MHVKMEERRGMGNVPAEPVLLALAVRMVGVRRDN